MNLTLGKPRFMHALRIFEKDESPLSLSLSLSLSKVNAILMKCIGEKNKIPCNRLLIIRVVSPCYFYCFSFLISLFVDFFFWIDSHS